MSIDENDIKNSEEERIYQNRETQKIKEIIQKRCREIVESESSDELYDIMNESTEKERNRVSYNSDIYKQLFFSLNKLINKKTPYETIRSFLFMWFLYFSSGAEGLINGGGNALGRASITDYVNIGLGDAMAESLYGVLSWAKTGGKEQIIAGKAKFFTSGGIEAADRVFHNFIKADVE